jgi:peptidoglycan/LPS O-acetylase OafA/YrhL
VVASTVASVRVCSVALLLAAKYTLLALPAPLFLNYAEYFAFGIVLFQRRVGLSTMVECAVLSLLLVGCMAIDSWRFAIYGPFVVGILIYRDINWAPARMLGLISYSLYLTHDTFGMWFRGAMITKLDLSPEWAITLAVIGSIAFAALFYWLIERPSLVLSKRISYAGQPSEREPLPKEAMALGTRYESPSVNRSGAVLDTPLSQPAAGAGRLSATVAPSRPRSRAQLAPTP